VYFSIVRTIKLENGERFSTVFRDDGVPAYYPACLALAKRNRGLVNNSLLSLGNNLIHLGLWAERENLDINKRLEDGDYFSTSEIETLVEACSYETNALRRLLTAKVSELRKGISFTQADMVGNGTKASRLSTARDYFELVAKMSEAHLPRKSDELAERLIKRKEMLEDIEIYRPKIRKGRTGRISHTKLAKVTNFLLSDQPCTDIWKDNDISIRNWTILRILLECGLRQGELRQLKCDDVDLRGNTISIYRRPDDPEDPRLNPPTQKTYDRKIPISNSLAQLIEDYMLGPGSDMATISGSPFLFLSHSNNSKGEPLGPKTVERIVKELGAHLNIKGLCPHDLRHTWMQNLANWSIENNIEPSEFERFANFLGGWSYLSKMATEYRGDQITEQAYKAGLKVQVDRDFDPNEDIPW